MKKVISIFLTMFLLTIYCGAALATDGGLSNDGEKTLRTTYKSAAITNDAELLERARHNIDDSSLSKIDKLSGKSLSLTYGATRKDARGYTTDKSQDVLITTQLLEISESATEIMELYAITTIADVDVPGSEGGSSSSGSTYLYTTVYLTKRFNSMGVSTYVQFDYSTGRYSSSLSGNALVLKNAVCIDPFTYPSSYSNGTSIQYPTASVQYSLSSPYRVMFQPGYYSYIQADSELFYGSNQSLYCWVNASIK